MAIIHPFKSWRPTPVKAEQVTCVPYDVVSTDEARELAAGNPDSFLHVIRPEIDLPAGTPFDDDAVYEKGRENLQNLMKKGVIEFDNDRSIFIYRIQKEEHIQTGLFACVAVDDYDNNVILKHELTRPDKEDDRTRHILTQSAHPEPVMITYRDSEDITGLMNRELDKGAPLYDLTDESGIRHIIQKVDDIPDFLDAFGRIEKLYIADGHHRCKSASRAAQTMKENNPGHTGNEEYNFFPAVLFPEEQMRILPYNRIVFKIPDNFVESLRSNFEIISETGAEPQNKGTISVYSGNEWMGVRLPMPDNPNSVEQLDVHRLQKFILGPMLNITDPRTDKNITFVGGSRGTGELEKLVNTGSADLAISMYPTGIDELIRVSDEGLLMPPKSTWFDPKLRSGFLIHAF